MPYAENNGMKIHYHVEGQGQPVIMMHGLTTSMDQFIKAGYVDALKDDYKLILIDARGHGKSDQGYKPEDYEPSVMAADVLAILDDLNIEKVHLFGYSMGARIGYSLAAYAPERISSYILGGQHPFPRPPDQRANDLISIEAWEKRRIAVAAGAKSRRSPQDYDVFIAFRKKIMDWPPFPIETLYENIKVPALLYVGGADGRQMLTEQFAENLPHAKFVSLPGLDHDQAILDIDKVLPHVQKFLAEVSQTIDSAKG